MTQELFGQTLSREEGFDGSYDSVRNYIHRRARDEESPWARAYDLMVGLPKPRALDFIRCLARGQPPAFASAQLRSFIREAACPRMLPAQSSRERQRLLHIKRMRRLLQKESNEDDLNYDLGDTPGLSTLLGHLHNGQLKDRNRAMVVLASRRNIPNRTILNFWVSAKPSFAIIETSSKAREPLVCLHLKPSRTAKSTMRICGKRFSACFTNHQLITASIEHPGQWHSCAGC